MSDGSDTGGGSFPASLDGGAFLLHLLRNPPQSNPTETASPAPSRCPSEASNSSVVDPTVGPSYQFLHHHAFLRSSPPGSSPVPHSSVTDTQGFLPSHWSPPSDYPICSPEGFPLFTGQFQKPGMSSVDSRATFPDSFVSDPRRDPVIQFSGNESFAYVPEGKIMGNARQETWKVPLEMKTPHSYRGRAWIYDRNKPKGTENLVSVGYGKEKWLDFGTFPEDPWGNIKHADYSPSDCSTSGRISHNGIQNKSLLCSQNQDSVDSSECARRMEGDLIEDEQVENSNGNSSRGDVVIDVLAVKKEFHAPEVKSLDGGINSLVTNPGPSIVDLFRGIKILQRKESRYDSHRGHNVSGLKMRMQRRSVVCRYDIEILTPHLLSIYLSLVPAEEEKAKQRKLLASLEQLVVNEWPSAQLYLYGSCANSFGVSNSDIDVCLEIQNNSLSKPDILVRLADLLKSSHLQNVQALLHARVPIVKLMDPSTGISCDICINNMLAVVNTKLLRDYAQIDERLRQLAFVVKHWAKSRGVNETYRGTLSSYAYVLMCIHFLQLRQPAVLPCLQKMKATYAVIVDDKKCAYFDKVEMLRDFGSNNKESIGYLLWAFFRYWAYGHDYANDVISVRTGSIISKRGKDWTRRIGNDRHLICIEDPFETDHDLGRVVDKFSINILREEFERAANILQYDRRPWVTLFEPYRRSSPQD